jgi:hypothetical protein
VVTSYGEAMYAIIVFKNINELTADVCYYTNTFKTLEEAKQYQPKDTDYFKWFTEEGYTNEMAKPVMPTMKKKDAVEFANYLLSVTKKMNEYLVKLSKEEKTKAKFAMAMVLGALPQKYAEKKGFNSYKSIPIIEKGIKAFAKDKDVLKIVNQLKTLAK